VLSCRSMQAALSDPQNALVEGRCYPLLPCMCCCCDSEWCKEGVLSLSRRSCCHDPQNALAEEGVHPCAAMQARCCARFTECSGAEGCAIPALPCTVAARTANAP
jgi:hypothetical protein